MAHDWRDDVDKMHEHDRLVAERGGLVLPPTSEQIDALLRKHTVGAFQPEHSACSCDRAWRTHAAYREHVRDVVLALINGRAS